MTMMTTTTTKTGRSSSNNSWFHKWSHIVLLLLLLGVQTINSEDAVREMTCASGDGNCQNNDLKTTEKVKKPILNQEECTNKHENCDFWAKEDECNQNPAFMLHNCEKACGVCNLSQNRVQQEVKRRYKKLHPNENNEQQKEEKEEEEEKEPDATETPYGVSQSIVGERGAEVRTIVNNVTNYMDKIVFVDPKYHKVKNDCKNRHELCAFWSLIGECEANPAFMTLSCAPTCYSCHLIDFDTRCPYNASVPTVWNEGDLNRMFERMTTDSYFVENYKPTIHVMPDPPSEEIKYGPWVVTLDTFLTDEECDLLIQLGGEEGYEISMDVGAKKFDGSFEGYKNNRRTSTNAWCKEGCAEKASSVLQKIENVTGIPDANSEYLQLLQYNVGQFYKQHHDYIPHHTERQEGVRILTVFLYLNDVEEGGGTDFPGLGVTVQPKRGKVLIWPSVKNDNPNAKDPRTEHQALPVTKGIKFGANAWLHQRDFKEAYKRSCH